VSNVRHPLAFAALAVGLVVSQHVFRAQLSLPTRTYLFGAGVALLPVLLASILHLRGKAFFRANASYILWQVGVLTAGVAGLGRDLFEGEWLDAVAIISWSIAGSGFVAWVVRGARFPDSAR